MSELVFALPVSVEQIAVVIKQMNLNEQKRLVELVPALQRVVNLPPSVRTERKPRSGLSRLQAEVLAAVNNRPLSPDEPFLGDLTLEQYHALPDNKKIGLWDEWGGDNLMELEEQEVIAVDTLSA